MTWFYRDPTDQHYGYWRGVKPSSSDILAMLRDSNKEDYRIIIHGEPCKVSPQWAERNKEEAAQGKATFTYNVTYESIEYARIIADVYERTGYEDEYEGILSESVTFATNFANVLILATEERCWVDVEWIDFVDI